MAVRTSSPEAFAARVDRDWVLFGAPWITSRESFEKLLTKEEMIPGCPQITPGVFPRQGTSGSHPTRIPSLVGIQDIKYLDATGLVRHRSIADLMRYAVINMGLDTTAHFGDFQPSPIPTVFTAEPERAIATSNCTRWPSTCTHSRPSPQPESAR